MPQSSRECNRVERACLDHAYKLKRWYHLCRVTVSTSTTTMTVSGHMPRRAPTSASASPHHRSLSSACLVLVKKCRSRKASNAILATIFLIWCGCNLTLYRSHLTLIDGVSNIATSLQPITSSSTSHAESRRRTSHTQKLKSSSSSISSKRNQHRSQKLLNDTTMSKQQVTKLALDSSQLFVQRNANHAAMSRHHKNMQHAFAAVDFLDETTMMGNNDDDSLDTYYAKDDDTIRGSRYKNWPDGSEPICSTPSFYTLYRPTCNEVHSTVSGYQWLKDEDPIPKHQHQHERKHHDHLSRYLGEGTYRHVFLLERQFAINNSDEVVFKCMKRFGDGNTFEKRIAYNPRETYKNFEHYDDMRKDAMVMELLTHSPRIANIYSFCALSSIIEYAPGNIEKYVMPTKGYKKTDDDDPTPVNKLDGVEKLKLALEIAKGIATMHGHSDGVIANVDVQIGQFCRGKDGLVKILDFNRAEVMLYDEEQGEYCRLENGEPPDGSLRAPEEIIDAPLTEKIDVYSLGNVFYSILTGLLVNRDYSVDQAHARIIHGQTEDIDVSYFESRSEAEYALVKVIQLCWTYDAKDRPSVFDVVLLIEKELKSLSSA